MSALKFGIVKMLPVICEQMTYPGVFFQDLEKADYRLDLRNLIQLIDLYTDFSDFLVIPLDF